MPDQKPPRLAAAERETLLALLQYQRESMVRKVTGTDDLSAHRSPVPTGTSLLWLVRHLTRAEATWVLDRFAGLDVELPDEADPDGGVADAVDRYRRMWAEVDEVVGRASLDDLCRRADGSDPVNLRWVVMHLLEETARHAGHADIVRELLDGRTGR